MPTNFGFELDARGSLDPDNMNKGDALTYTWSCVEVSPNAGHECIQKNGDTLKEILKGGARIWVPKDIFVHDLQMKFTILVKENPYPRIAPRSASESILITTELGASLQVRIEESGGSRRKGYSPNVGSNLIAIIRGSALTVEKTTPRYKWSSNLFNFSEEHIPGPMGKYLQVPPLATPTTLSTLEITVEVALGSLLASSYIHLQINQPPHGGDLNILPSTGIAMYTPFTFHAPNWVDDDLPLAYSLYYSLLPYTTNATLNNWKLLVQKSTDPAKLGRALVLPQGNAINSYVIYIKLKVGDLYGTTTQLIKELVVSPFPAAGVLGKSLFLVATEMVQNVPDSSRDLVLQVLYYIFIFIFIYIYIYIANDHNSFIISRRRRELEYYRKNSTDRYII